MVMYQIQQRTHLGWLRFPERERCFTDGFRTLDAALACSRRFMAEEAERRHFPRHRIVKSAPGGRGDGEVVVADVSRAT
jgi:hypothetical protein